MSRVRLKIIDDNDTIEQVLNIPELKALTTGDRNFLGNLTREENAQYIGGYVDSNLIGFIPTKILTNRTLECHIYIKPEYWGTGYAEKFARLFIWTINDIADYKIIYSYAPDSSLYGNSFLGKLGFNLLSKIPRGVEYFGEVTDLNLYTLELGE